MTIKLFNYATFQNSLRKIRFSKKKNQTFIAIGPFINTKPTGACECVWGGGGDFCLNWTDFTIYGIAQAIWAVIIAWKILSDNIALIKHGEHETMVSFLYTLVLLSLVQLSKLYK